MIRITAFIIAFFCVSCKGQKMSADDCIGFYDEIGLRNLVIEKRLDYLEKEFSSKKLVKNYIEDSLSMVIVEEEANVLGKIVPVKYYFKFDENEIIESKFIISIERNRENYDFYKNMAAKLLDSKKNNLVKDLSLSHNKKNDDCREIFRLSISMEKYKIIGQVIKLDN